MREASSPDLAFCDFLDQISFLGEGGSVPAFLRRIIDTYSLRSAAYLVVNLPNSRQGAPYIAATYSDEWVSHYRAQEYHRLDPVVTRGFDSLMPVDWAILDRSAPKVRRLFGEAREFGVGRHGLLFPIRGRHGERGIFTVSADETDQTWLNIRRQLVRDLQIVAHHIHRLVLTAETIAPAPVSLTQREIDVLQWAAMGKTQAQMAKILSIGERTVLHYIEAARAKLDALNTTHAVAKAVGMNLIVGGM